MLISITAACTPNAEDEPTGGTPPGDSPTAARQCFIDDVKPLVESTCADCHSNVNDEFGAPDFLDVIPTDYYASLVSRTDFVGCDVDNSLLLVKGLDADHPGGDLTPPQHERVKNWLNKEAMERFGGKCTTPTPTGEEEPPGPLTGLDAIAQFGACMTLEDWLNKKMDLVANQTALSQDQVMPCYSCHAGGQGSNWMPDPQNSGEVSQAFEKMRVPYKIFKLIQWTVNDEDGSFKDIVPANRWRDKGKEKGHPEYTLEPQYVEYIDQWFQLTYDKWKSGTCTLKL